MKLNRKWLLVIALVMSLAMATAGTLAYLTESDAAANVMTLGKVEIKQHEYERVIENGIYKTETIDGTTSYVLKAFTQGKPLMPATELDANGNPNNHGAGGWDSTTVRMSQVGSYGGMQVFQSKNAQDKFVTVENTGRSDAYVRTIVAIEAGETDGNLVRCSYHQNWNKDAKKELYEIGGNKYSVIEFVYKGAQLDNGSWRHENGILPAGDTSYPNLSQVYLMYSATNEDVEKLDGNDNGVLDILVLSQAVQADGFADAKTALNAGFGEADETNVAKWFGDSGVAEITVVETLEEFKAALKKSGTVVLTKDITLDNTVEIETGVDVKLDLSGKKITFEPGASYVKEFPMFLPNAGAKLTITGNGTVDLGENFGSSIFAPRGELVIENGKFIAARVTDGTVPQGLFIGVGSNESKVVINGGYFDSGYYDANAEMPFSETADDVKTRGSSADKNLYRTAIKKNIDRTINLSVGKNGTEDFKIYGGTFVGANPAWGDEGCAMPTTPDYLRPWSHYQGTFLEGQQMYDDKLEIPAGYTITEGKTDDGRPTYTVTYSK